MINKTKIDLFSEDHKVLFQDTKPLLNLAQNDLESEIEKRIKLHNEILVKKQAENSEPIASVEESDEQDVIGDVEVEEEPLTVEKNYRTIIKMLSTKDKAIELQNKIRVDDAYREFIEDITIENNNQ